MLPPPLGVEGALMNGMRPDPLDAFSEHNDIIFSRKRPNL